MSGQRWAAYVCMAALSGSACGGSPAAPSTPGTPGTPGTPSLPFTTTVRLVDVLTALAVSGASATGTSISGGPSDSAGRMTIGSETSASDPRLVTFSQSSAVTRQVSMKIPGSDVTVSLIPTSFDLDAFDEFMRVTQLQRWTSAPPLRVQSRLLEFTSVTAADAVGLDEVLTEAERAGLESDLTWALPQLTGSQFQAFASITRETVEPGARMSVLNTGVITVARYRGLQAATGYWGYSRWQYRSDGTVISGTIMLDRDFDRSGSIYRRSLRTHELGHALGYTHVTRRTSVMNSSAVTEPNAFDLDAARIGFQRPPGNRRPDADPAGTSANIHAGAAVWSAGAGARGPVTQCRGLTPGASRSGVSAPGCSPTTAGRAPLP